MDDCIHLMDPAHCTLCNGRAARETKAAHTVRQWFIAGYPGHCEGCHDRIRPGEEIAQMEDGSYKHWGCK